MATTREPTINLHLATLYQDNIWYQRIIEQLLSLMNQIEDDFEIAVFWNQQVMSP